MHIMIRIGWEERELIKSSAGGAVEEVFEAIPGYPLVMLQE